ncbi:TrmH family RNA methyltransferase [Trueperella sp. LYQ143]|uniref:TrmH family RNA methyltransferase n=1 Tax=unclassified Trueperella TaxID=2630174 RepID=UPI0039839A82
MIVELDSLADPRLADFTQLTDTALRRKLETERGLFLAESDKVIRRALAAGHHPRAFVMAPRWLAGMRDVVEQWPDVPVFIVAQELLQELTGYRVHRGALASMYRPQLPSASDFLRAHPAARRLFILEDLVNHTNVGAIFRSAAALGCDGVLVTDHCCDPLYRRSVKVSMGTVFQIPWTRIEHWPHSMEILRDHGWITASLALREDALTLAEFSQIIDTPDSKVALILGSEGDGLAPATISQADYAVRIPMAGGVDSLNVAAAGAVAAWELRVR